MDEQIHKEFRYLMKNPDVWGMSFDKERDVLILFVSSEETEVPETLVSSFLRKEFIVEKEVVGEIVSW